MELMEEQAKASTFKKRTAHDGLEVLTRARKKPALTTVAEEGSDSGVSEADFMGMALSYGKPKLEDEEAPESESQRWWAASAGAEGGGEGEGKGQDQGKGQGQGTGRDQGATRVRSRPKTT